MTTHPEIYRKEVAQSVFEAADCPYCKQFKAEVLDHWKSDAPIARTLSPQPPAAER